MIHSNINPESIVINSAVSCLQWGGGLNAILNVW